MRILIAEDERPLADGLADGLRAEGHAVEVVYDGAAALVTVATGQVDLLILDRDLPAVHGDTVAATLRGQGHPVLIVMLTAARSLDQRVSGFDLGADAYLTKPFAYVELLANLRALERRVRQGARTVFEAGGLTLDTTRRIVERDGLPLRLAPKEYGVLEALTTAEGGWVSPEELLDEVWPEAVERDRGLLRVAVYTLRRKLGRPDPIESATGHGYRIGGR